MRSIRLALAALLVFTTLSALAQTGAQQAFDRLKSLSGSWQGKNSQRHPVTDTFRLVSGGSVVMSQLNHQDMVTMYHLDANRLVMTHYCEAGNQPRFTAELSPDGKLLTFKFLDATNLASPDAGHMHRVVFTFVDSDHLVEDWTFVKGGKEIEERFELQREMSSQAKL